MLRCQSNKGKPYFFDWSPIEQLDPFQVGTDFLSPLWALSSSRCRPTSTGAPQDGSPSFGKSQRLIAIQITRTKRREKRLSIPFVSSLKRRAEEKPLCPFILEIESQILGQKPTIHGHHDPWALHLSFYCNL